jgi:hypothetical protein
VYQASRVLSIITPVFLHVCMQEQSVPLFLAFGPCMYALDLLDNVLFSTLQYGKHVHILYLPLYTV